MHGRQQSPWLHRSVALLPGLELGLGVPAPTIPEGVLERLASDLRSAR